MLGQEVKTAARLLLASAPISFRLKFAVNQIMVHFASVNYNEYIKDQLDELNISHDPRYDYKGMMEHVMRYYNVPASEMEELSQDIIVKLVLPGVRSNKTVFDSYLESAERKGYDPSSPKVKGYFMNYFKNMFKGYLTNQVSRQRSQKNRDIQDTSSYDRGITSEPGSGTLLDLIEAPGDYTQELEARDILRDLKKRSSPTQREILEFLLRGYTIKDLMPEVGMSRYKVNIEVDKLRGLVEEIYEEMGTPVPA